MKNHKKLPSKFFISPNEITTFAILAGNRLKMREQEAKIIGISRLRLTTDGDGVTTLVAFYGCPLRCQYCLNPQSFGKDRFFKEYTPKELYKEVKIDELYFLATNGGITFGGGEPCLFPDFISEFRTICGNEWQINIETSLNVPHENIAAILPVANSLIIDIKDINPEIYINYTEKDNAKVLSNLRMIAEQERQNDCIIRLPLIPDYNTETDRNKSRETLESLGFSKFDLFTYKIRKH